MTSFLLLLITSFVPLCRSNFTQFTPYIEGGQQATVEQIPYMAAILEIKFGKNHMICTGTIIDRRFIVTAAHCFDDIASPKDILVRVGSTHADSGGDLMTVMQFFTHPRFGPWSKPKNSYDIALVIPTEFIEMDGELKMAKPLPFFDQHFKPNHRCVIAGYGLTMDDQEDAQPARLHYLMMMVREDKMCKMSFGKNFREQLMICTGYLHVSGGACAGDSGSPFFCSGVLYGVTSANYFGCKVEGGLNMMTNVGAFAIRAWIQQMTGL